MSLISSGIRERCHHQVGVAASILNTVFIDRSSFAAQERARVDLRSHFEALRDETASFDNPLARYKRQIAPGTSSDEPLSARISAVEGEIETLRFRVSASASEGRQPVGMKPSFEQFNRAMLTDDDKRIAAYLVSNQFTFTYNPKTRQSTKITFEQDGSIGGRSQQQ